METPLVPKPLAGASVFGGGMDRKSAKPKGMITNEYSNACY
jgi:hypothetical protein